MSMSTELLDSPDTQEQPSSELQTAPIEATEPTSLKLGEDANEEHRGKAESNNGLVQWVEQDGTVRTAFEDTPGLMESLSAKGIALGEAGSVDGVELSNANDTQEKGKLTIARAKQVQASVNKLAVERGVLGRIVKQPDGSEVMTANPFDPGEIRLLDSAKGMDGTESYTVFDNVDGAPISPDRQGYVDGVGKFTEVGGIITFVTPEGRVQSVADSPFALKRLRDLSYTRTSEITGRYGNPKAGDSKAHEDLYWLLKDKDKE